MKKAFTTITLAIVMAFGSTFALAGDGIIVFGREAAPQCTTASAEKDGIIVFGRDGIIVFGIVIYQPSCTPAAARDGILVGD